MNEYNFLSEFKKEFYTKEIDQKHSYNRGHDHPYIIKIGGCSEFCVNGFSQLSDRHPILEHNTKPVESGFPVL
jgi:hypothetical protein